jgi:hypothetical protein
MPSGKDNTAGMMLGSTRITHSSPSGLVTITENLTVIPESAVASTSHSESLSELLPRSISSAPQIGLE